MGNVIRLPIPPGGGFVVQAFDCPRAPGWCRTFGHAADADDAAEALAIEIGTGWCLMCDP